MNVEAPAPARERIPGMSFWVVLTIREAKTDAIVKETRVDFNRTASREWLFKTLVWAWTNKKTVEMFNERDKDLVEAH